MLDTETVLRSLYAALARGDGAAALALMHPRIRWAEAERSPYYRGEVEGREAVRDTVLTPIGQDFETFTITPREFLADGRRAVVVGRYGGRVRETGRVLSADFAHLWTVADGLALSFRQITDSAAWSEAFAGP